MTSAAHLVFAPFAEYLKLSESDDKHEWIRIHGHDIEVDSIYA